MFDTRPSQPGRDQADELRTLVRQMTPSALTIAVTSGKGGVGKTNLSVNLALCLTARGHRVTLLDADFGLANADLLLNLEVQNNLAHVLAGQCGIEDAIHHGPGGLRLIPGASGVASLANLSEFERHHLVRMLAPLERDSDYLLFDCGAGIGENVLTLARSADIVLVVTTPEPTSMTDAYGIIKSLVRGRYSGAVGLVVNMAASRLEAQKTLRRIQSVATRFLQKEVVDYGYVFDDDRVRQGIRLRAPVVLRYPRCPASACMMVIAAQIAEDAGDRSNDVGFFKKVANLFF